MWFYKLVYWVRPDIYLNNSFLWKRILLIPKLANSGTSHFRMLQFINFFSQSFNSPSIKVCVLIELVISKTMAISVFTYEIVSHSLKVWKTLKTDLFCLGF